MLLRANTGLGEVVEQSETRILGVQWTEMLNKLLRENTGLH